MPATGDRGEHAGRAGPRLVALELHLSESVAKASRAPAGLEPDASGHIWGLSPLP